MDNLELTMKKKSRRTLLMVIAAFALPIIIAKLALEQQWLDYGVTNKGRLLESELTLAKLGLAANELPKQWLIIYAQPKICTELCEQILESVHNTYVALGREMPRVTPVALIKSPLSKVQSDRIAQSQWQVTAMPAETPHYINQAEVLLVDPLGNIILTHTPPTNNQDLNDFGKQILADMKKLLKYSRVG